MKYFLMLALSISFGKLAAQVNSFTLAEMNTTNADRFGAFSFFTNPAKGVDGSVYLYENWNNSVIIHTSDNKKLLIKNVNLNLMRNAFEAKITQDSIFSFNFNNIEKFVVNNREFKNFYYDDDNRVYELIFDSEDLSILKGFEIKIIEASSNPMNNRPRDRYIQNSSFFVKKGGKIKPFVLKKSKILNLFEDDGKIVKIKEYVQKNNLSYRNESDVQKIMKYYDYIKTALVSK